MNMRPDALPLEYKRDYGLAQRQMDLVAADSLQRWFVNERLLRGTKVMTNPIEALKTWVEHELTKAKLDIRIAGVKLARDQQRSRRIPQPETGRLASAARRPRLKGEENNCSTTGVFPRHIGSF
jgi:hypothetical protein